MKKRSNVTAVTVKKPFHSICMPIIFMVILSIMTLCATIKSGSAKIAFALLPMDLCVTFFLIYNLYWHIVFEKDAIVYSSLFSHRRYTYSQILEVTEYHHYKGYDEIVILFKDKKKVTITQMHRNYIPCRKTISARCSIKTA